MNSMSNALSDRDAAELKDRLAEDAARAEVALTQLLPADDILGAHMPVAAAMRHAVMSGGKRLRAALAMEAAALFGVPAARANRVGAALECLHAYSLVHDDLPAMDDDDMRRGQPTVHVKWDEATAVLAGDALQTLAFEILAHPDTHPDPLVRAELCLGLARASGVQGMVGGQALDIAAETAQTPLDMPAIRQLQGLKTGALISFSAEAGAMLAGCDAIARETLRAYADDLGLAFQIKDDLLDVEGDETAAGKKLGKDADAGKATYVSLMGVETARKTARDLADRAQSRLSGFGAAARPLALLADFAVSRSH